MEPSGDTDRLWLLGLIALLDGPGWRGREEFDRAVGELRAAGLKRLLPALTDFLRDPDLETRYLACTAAMLTDEPQGVELVLPLLNDPEPTVRWHVCGLMHDLGDERAIGPLTDRMKNDPDPQVRGDAAYALGASEAPSPSPI
jgi:HEAT repeat protein